MFRKIGDDGKAKVFVVAHVDDILVAAPDTATLEGFVVELCGKFSIKDLGDANFYRGFVISRVSGKKAQSISISIYVETVAERYEVTRESVILAAPGGMPLAKQDAPQTTEEVAEIRDVRYREAVGALLWTSTMTRPDVSDLVRTVAKSCDDPGKTHLKAMLQIIQYMLRTKGLKRLTFGGDKGGDIHISAYYADADPAVCINRRRSVSNGAVMLVGAAITDFLRDGFLGTSELEHIALAEIVREVSVVFASGAALFVVPEMEQNSVPVMEDNQAAIKLA